MKKGYQKDIVLVLSVQLPGAAKHCLLHGVLVQFFHGRNVDHSLSFYFSLLAWFHLLVFVSEPKVWTWIHFNDTLKNLRCPSWPLKCFHQLLLPLASIFFIIILSLFFIFKIKVRVFPFGFTIFSFLFFRE